MPAQTYQDRRTDGQTYRRTDRHVWRSVQILHNNLNLISVTGHALCAHALNGGQRRNEMAALCGSVVSKTLSPPPLRSTFPSLLPSPLSRTVSSHRILRTGSASE